MQSIERFLKWAVYVGVFLLLLTPLVVAESMFFPFITGKNFFFRIVTEFIFASWITLAILVPEYRPKKSIIFISLSLFIGAVTVSAIFGVDRYHSFWSNFERMEGLVTHLHLYALFISISHTLAGKKIWNYIFLSSVGVSMFVSVHGFLQSIGKAEIIGGGRPFASFGNSIYLAVYLLFHLFILFGIIYFARALWLKGLAVLLFIFELYVFFMAASRGALLGLSVGLFVMALLSIFSSKNTIVKGVAIFTIIFIVFGFFAVFNFPDSAIVKNFNVLSRISTISIEGLSQDSRIMIWGIAINAFKERPILGWGPENFIIPYGKYYNPDLFAHEPWFDRTHNMLLEWLVATGIIGFSLYIGLFASILFVVYKSRKEKNMDTKMAILLIGFVAAYIIQNAFVFDNIITYIFLIMFLAYVNLNDTGRSNNKIKARRELSTSQVTGSAATLIVIVIIGVTVNVRPMLAANQIITALQSVQKETGIEKVISEYDKVIEYGTFGTTEARERVSDMVVQVALNVEGTNEAFNKLLDYSISEMEKEAESQKKVAKYPLFLGKLYAIKGNITGEGLDKSVERYNSAIEIAPNYVQSYLGLAETYLLSGENDKAVEAAKNAYSLQSKNANTKSALFYPVLSVHLLASDFENASILISEFRDEKGEPIFNIFSVPETKLLIERANRSHDSIELANFYLEWNNMFVEDYGFSEPHVLSEIIRVYESLGYAEKAKETADLYANPTLKNKAIDYATNYVKNVPSVKENIDIFIESFESLP